MKISDAHAVAIFLAAFVVAPLDSHAMPPRIQIDPVTVRVVDAETGSPVAGAVVAVAYPVYVESGRNWHGPHYEQSGDLHIAEAITDADGIATFEAFTADPPPHGSYLAHDVPLLLIYKAGYQPARVTEEPRNDNYKGVMDVPSAITSRFASEGATVKLQHEQREGLTEVNRNQAVGFMEGFLPKTGSCRWRRFPTLRTALEQSAKTRPLLRSRLEMATSDPACAMQLAIAWAGHADELHVDVKALVSEGGYAVPSPLSESANITIVANPDGERGILFVKRSGSDEKYSLRLEGDRATLGPLSLRKGEQITVDFLNAKRIHGVDPQISN